FQRLKDDFEYYAPRCLMIRTKEDGVQPFELNEAQKYLHEIAEQQLKREGHVRIIVLKGRQQGASTYIEGRYYWKVSHQKGKRAYILTHEGDATTNLFAMVQRYHENCPPELRPHTDRDSGKELNFDGLDSGYKVGTAGSKGTGRSSTIQYFHGSEVAFWPHAGTHATGVMQAIPGGNTEVFLESTSDGMGNYFHQTWVKAVAGVSEFIAVFIPWFWQSEYRVEIPKDEDGNPVEITLDDDELLYVEQYSTEEHPVTIENMLWRRKKIPTLENGEDDFKREYPADAEEAFESAGYRQLIPASQVTRAIKNRLRNADTAIEARGPIVMGVDPARFGDDRLAICLRQGRVAFDVSSWVRKMDQMEITGIVKGILDSIPIDRCFIDEGMGVGVIDRLHEQDYVQVQGVNFGAGAWNQQKYTNRRNEMWQEMAEWFKDSNVQLFTQTTEDVDDKIKAITMDLCAPEYKFNSRNIKVLEEKDETKKRLGMSPDLGDALALTFAEPVAEYYHEDSGKGDQGRNSKTGY
ncbi:MAG: hypothetical protein ACR2PR_06920, partial [Pseudohongiellaceae bacterium]